MPLVVKQAAPHFLIAMFVAPIMLGMFSWAGGEFLDHRDVKVKMPHLEKDLKTILRNQASFELKQDEVLQSVWANQADIRINKTDIEYLKKN